MRSSRFDRILICALVATALLACSQDKDQPCQVDGDCDDGLICVGARRSERGTCEDPSNVDAAAAGSGGAAGETALNPDADAGQEPDGGASGAGGASGTGGVSGDASVPTAGSPADAGPDAGDAGDLGEDAGG
jgi:hypothetical protein